MGDLFQEHVAHCLALRVVDAGEVVDIEHQNRKPALPRQGPRDLPLQYLQQAPPVGQSGERVVVGEIAHARLALAQLVLSLLGAHQEFDALRQQHGIDSLGREVGCARVVRAFHGLHVIEACLHQYRHVAALRQCTQCAAHLEAAHTRHDDIEHHAIRGMLAKLPERGLAIDRRDDAEARHFQRRADQQSGAGVVVDDQYRGQSDGLQFRCVHWVL